MNEIELKRMIEYRYNSVRAFALENEIPYTTMRSILERGIMNAKAETIFKICAALGIKPEIFATSPDAKNGTVQAINDKVVQLHPERQENVLGYATEQLEEQEKEEQPSLEINEPLFEYRVYEKAAAGNGYGYTGDRNYDIAYFDEEIPHDFATWIWGDSMEPTYLNGEVALIRDGGYDYDGAVYLVDWDGQSYIKKVYKEKDGLRLVSLNKKYADKFAAWEEEPRIIGKVIGSFQPMER
ncbi:LexA family transcriptional regulator [Streptococcus himalayensis]|uniref:HTH cro/C1-type domain-containing protein n=1 Tax=Streptococcus himalayensis TaxID=1888195 RepID=A0A917A4E5_9STRE|nr:XRE family transcriptional regulator [Streptococcus himalayensis]QBX25405.1 putative cI-like repressor [Streptococcus phage Javan254]GGE26567.1 hypothetical protein GCM10011510_04700 [Streptococcus himalayensis]